MHCDLQILYQDQHLAAIYKPAGHLVHPADQPQEDDLVAMKILRDQLGQPVFPIHRLDRPTSGVLLFGLTKEATRELVSSLEKKEWQKTYWAVVTGTLSETSWECKTPIQKKENAPFRDAHTSFKLLKSVPPPSLSEIKNIEEHENQLHLIEAIPHTGRFHQIRRHLLHNNTPIIGDYRYAGIERSHALCTALDIGTRMLLTAKSLTLPHPFKEAPLTITAPTDDAILKCFPDLSENSIL